MANIHLKAYICYWSRSACLSLLHPISPTPGVVDPFKLSPTSHSFCIALFLNSRQNQAVTAPFPYLFTLGQLSLLNHPQKHFFLRHSDGFRYQLIRFSLSPNNFKTLLNNHSSNAGIILSPFFLIVPNFRNHIVRCFRSKPLILTLCKSLNMRLLCNEIINKLLIIQPLQFQGIGLRSSLSSVPVVIMMGHNSWWFMLLLTSSQKCILRRNTFNRYLMFKFIPGHAKTIHHWALVIRRQWSTKAKAGGGVHDSHVLDFTVWMPPHDVCALVPITISCQDGGMRSGVAVLEDRV